MLTKARSVLRQQRALVIIVAIVALTVTFGYVASINARANTTVQPVAATTAPTSTPSEQPPAPAARKPLNPAATALIVSAYRAEVDEEGNPIEGGFIFGPPSKPVYLEFQSPCSAAAVSRVGNKVYFVSAEHCVSEQLGKEATKYDFQAQKREREKAEAASATTSTTPETDPSSTPDKAKDDKPVEIAPKLTVYLYQPVTVQNRYILVPQQATLVSTRKPENGNDSAIIELTLNDPSVNVPVLPLASSEPGSEARLRTIGYPGSHINGLDEALFPNRHHQKKGVLDIIQTEFIAPTTTDGIVGGTQRSSGSPMTETNADMSGGMSGGGIVNDAGEYVATVHGGIMSFGGGGNFNFGSSNLSLLREDLINAGALPRPSVTDAQIQAAVDKALSAHGIPSTLTAAQIDQPVVQDSQIEQLIHAVYALIGLIVLLVILAVLFFIVRWLTRSARQLTTWYRNRRAQRNQPAEDRQPDADRTDVLPDATTARTTT